MSLEQLTPIIQTATSFLIALSGLLAILGAFFNPVRKWITKRFSDSEARQKELEEKRKESQAIKDALEKMNLRLDDFKAVLANEHSENALLKKALVGMLRDRLTTIYNQAESRGYIDTEYRKNFIEMYDIYCALGGNHYVHELYEKIKDMPGKPPKRTPQRVIFWSDDAEGKRPTGRARKTSKTRVAKRD